MSAVFLDDLISLIRSRSQFFTSNFDLIFSDDADIFFMYVFFIIRTCSVRSDMKFLRKNVNHKNSFNCVLLTRMNHFIILILCFIDDLILDDSSINSIIFNFSIKTNVFFELKYIKSKTVREKYRVWRNSHIFLNVVASQKWSSANNVIATLSWSFMMMSFARVVVVVDKNSKMRFVNYA